MGLEEDIEKAEEKKEEKIEEEEKEEIKETGSKAFGIPNIPIKRPGGGGGFDWGKIIIIIAIIGIIAIAGFLIYFWFIHIGGGQATSGLGSRIGESFSGIFNSYIFRSFSNMLKNPFGIGPTGGKYETTEQKEKAPPNQAFSISIRGSIDTAIMNQHSLTFIVTVKNLGSSKINKLNVRLDSLTPFDDCLRFTNGKGYGRNKTLFDIEPFSTREIVFSGGWIDLICMKGHVIDNVLKPNTNTPVYIRATAWTYYPTASRLAAERIKNDFGILLIKNNVLRQKSSGAVYKYGSAMTIDMDIGAQPILDNSKTAALLLRWQNVGNGQMKSKVYPYVFIITPNDFGECIPAGYKEYDNPNDNSCKNSAGCIVCDQELVGSWCKDDSDVRKDTTKYTPDVNPVLDWACNLASNGKMHVCGTTHLTEEFNVFTCELNIPQIKTTDDIVTDYITVLAAYPYEVNSQTVKVNTFCTQDQKDEGCGGQ